MAASIDVLDLTGASVGSVDLPDAWFSGDVNVAVMHQVVTAQLAAARQGTHKTKTRAERRGGGAKPLRQKGTGRARQGSIRAPQWVGGGDRPRSYPLELGRPGQQEGQARRAPVRADRPGQPRCGDRRPWPRVRRPEDARRGRRPRRVRPRRRQAGARGPRGPAPADAAVVPQPPDGAHADRRPAQHLRRPQERRRGVRRGRARAHRDRSTHQHAGADQTEEVSA